MLNWKNTSLLVLIASLCGCSGDPQKEKQKYLASGLGYTKKGQYDAAIVQFRNALRQDPRSVDTLNHLAEAYVANRQPREAYAALMEATAIDPNRNDVRLNLGRLYLSAGDFKKAEEQASLIVQQDANNAAAEQILGASLTGQQQNDKAIQVLQKAVQLSPSDASSFVNLGVSFARAGNRAEAEANFQKAIAVDPHHIPAWVGFAGLLRQAGELSRAEQTLQSGLEKNPQDVNLRLALADLYLQQGKTGPLDSLLNDVRKQMPKPEVALALGDFFAARNQVQRALSEYQWGAGIAPSNLDVKARLVDVYMNTGNLAEAEKWNSAILQERPKDVRAGLAHGRILLAQGKADEATIVLREQVSEARDSSAAHYYLALAYIRNLHSEQAKAELKDAVRLQPGFLAARLSLGELHLTLGELAAARQVMEETVRMYPNSPAVRPLLASVLLRQGDVAAARQQLTVARDLAPKDPAIPMMLGATYAAEHKTQDAQREYEAALKLDPNYAPAHAQLSALWVANGQSAKALDYLKQQADEHPNDPEPHFLLGSLYRQTHDYSHAETELSRTVQLAPNRIDARVQLGAVYQQLGRLGAAIEQYEAALKIQPRSASIEAILGSARLKNGELDVARKHFEQGLALDPNSAVMANNLAFLNAASGGNLDAALALAQKARELAPDLVNAADTLGWIQYKKGLYPSAVRLLEECVRKSPQSATYQYHLGMALMATGDRERGRSSLDTALRLNLAGEDATQARDTLAKSR
jgi:tetratricopeptide (TPR) repeat protein